MTEMDDRAVVGGLEHRLDPGHIAPARRAVATRAADAEELLDLLRMLGLLPDPLAKQRRSK